MGGGGWRAEGKDPSVKAVMKRAAVGLSGTNRLEKVQAGARVLSSLGGQHISGLERTANTARAWNSVPASSSTLPPAPSSPTPVPLPSVQP